MKRLMFILLVLSGAAGSAAALSPKPVPPVPPPPPTETRQCWIEPWYCKPPITNPPAAPRFSLHQAAKPT